jgi:tRNA(Ile)-lysidine synthase
MTSLPDIARATADRYEMLPGGAAVVALVSGGADSVTLLYLLAAGELGSGLHLSALHVNHLLRGADADADEAFVRELCGRLGVDLRVVRFDVAAHAAAADLNLEDAGRQVRYRFAAEELDARCDAAGVERDRGRIAVGHTLDDRMETCLMRLAQGAGATGLSSLRPVRDRIVRPLIGARRAEVRDHLRAAGEAWREDATNADTDRLRAHVRHELLPVFERINPRFDHALERTLELFGAEEDLLAGMGEAFAAQFVEREEGRVALDPHKMNTLSRAMQRRTLRAAIGFEFPEASRLEFEHVEAVLDGMGDPSFARDLPDGLRVRARYGTIVIARAGEGPRPLAPCLLRIPGIADLGAAGRIVAEFSSADDTGGTPDSVVIDADLLVDGVVIGSVREGDRMAPLGMTGSKKLSDLLIDAKVPREERPGVPVVRDGERIVWVAGVRMAEEYKVTERTRRALRITWERDG